MIVFYFLDQNFIKVKKLISVSIIGYEQGGWSGEAHLVEEEWNDQSRGNKKGRENQIHFARGNKKATSIKEVVNNMTLDTMEWRKIIHVVNYN